MHSPEYFECSCHTPEHTLRLWFDDDKDFPCVYASVFLANGGVFRRLKNAAMYLFGYKCAYGHFEEFVMRPEDADRMIAIMEALKKAKPR